MLELDESIIFFENKSNVNFINVNKNFLNAREMFLLNEDVYNPFRGSNTKQNGTVFVGFNSDFAKNSILNSDFYKKDERYKTNKITSFNDSEEYAGEEITIFSNPLILRNSYGQTSADEIFDSFFEDPFEDVDNIENVNEFLLTPDVLKYPRYFNTYSLLRLNSNISIFGTLEELNGDLLTEKPLVGIKAEIIKSSLDASERAINISDSINLSDMSTDENGNQRFTVEAFTDEEYTEIVTGDDVLLQRSFSYTNKLINGQVYTVFDTSDNATSTIPQFTNKIIFYTEDSASIPPFDDTRTINFYNEGETINSPFEESRSNEDSDYDQDEFYSSSGQDSDNSNGGNPRSMGFEETD